MKLCTLLNGNVEEGAFALQSSWCYYCNMKSFNHYFKEWDMSKVGKTIALVLIGLVAIMLVVGLLQTILFGFTGKRLGSMVAPGMPMYQDAVDSYYGYGEGDMKTSYGGGGVGMPELSARNVFPMPGSAPTVGDTAEEYEVRDYSAHIETGNLDETCGTILDLKSRDYVVFENSNTYDRGCSYTFKVKTDRVEEVLAQIKALDPKDLSENTYTIKRQIDDFTSEVDTWKNKLKTIDETLKSATSAYDQVTKIATQNGDASALAKIIDSKIQVIERLTQERLAAADQLDRFSRAKAEQLDRLDYTYFSVNVTESRYVDIESLKDSWKGAIRDFVRTINEIVQGSTITLIAFLFFLVHAALYILVVVFAAKWGWKWVKKIWNS